MRHSRLLRPHRPAAPPTLVSILLGLVIVLVALLGAPIRIAAHAAIDRADPPINGLLAAPPARIDLWLTEAVDQGGGSPSISLFDTTGNMVNTDQATVDPDDPRHVIVTGLTDLGPGTFTVAWSVRSLVDGHTLSGTYGFRVGASRVPGAATVEGAQPVWWAVADRWLAFFGIALAAGGFAFGRFIVPSEVMTLASRRRWLTIAIGGLLALVATIAEPWLHTIAPVVGSRAPTLAEAIRGAPAGWWLRLGALIILVPLAVLLLMAGRRLTHRAIIEWVGLALGLAALLGLSLTSHAAARETLMPVALAANVLHQWAIGLWVGGLVHLALAWSGLRQLATATRPTKRATSSAVSARPPAAESAETHFTDPVRRFSRLALLLAVVAIATGIANAGFVLPSLSALLASLYGRLILLKLLVLAPVLALATFHRTSLRRFARRLGAITIPGWSIRLESVLALTVILGGSVLTLTAPAGSRASPPLVRLDLVAPLSMPTSSKLVPLHLELQPARPGPNALVMHIDRGDQDSTPDLAVASFEVTFTPLDHAGGPVAVAPVPDPLGNVAVARVDLPGVGWWQANVTVTPVGLPATGTTFFFALPDLNVTGQGPTGNANDPAAEALFRRGLASTAALHRVRFTSRLTSGAGDFQLSETTLSDGSDGNPASDHLVSANFERIIVGDRGWVRIPGQAWTERGAISLLLPAAWAADYVNATDFRLGPVQQLDGELCQVITFHTPAEKKAPGWYVWWVGTESGQVRGEAMVSNLHYMLYHFMDFDAPVTITPPAMTPPSASPATISS